MHSNVLRASWLPYTETLIDSFIHFEWPNWDFGLWILNNPVDLGTRLWRRWNVETAKTSFMPGGPSSRLLHFLTFLAFAFSWCFTLSLTSQINRYNNYQESLFQAPNWYIHLSLLFNCIYNHLYYFSQAAVGPWHYLSLCEGLGPGCLREYRRGRDSKVFLGESHGVETRSFEEVMYPGLDTHAPEPSQSQIKEPFN